MTEKNVYRRLQDCRIALQGMKLKATGKNSFANYTYLELEDFLPTVMQLFSDHGLCSVVNFGADAATLRVFNIDKPQTEFIEFVSPMSTAELKGCHAVQNLGAVQSYLRRYLYLACMEIVEHDALDLTQGKEGKKEEGKREEPKKDPPKNPQQKTPKEPATDEQLAKIADICMALADKTGNTPEEMLKLISIFPGKDGDVWLKMDTLKAQCSKGWAGKAIAKGEEKLKELDDEPF